MLQQNEYHGLNTRNAPKQVVYFEIIHPKVPLDHTCNQYKAKLATGHQPQLIHYSWASCATCKINNFWTARWTHSDTFQSKPAGQRRAPVTGWWNLRFVLTLRERTGCRTPSRGVIQSTTTPFRIFISSERAPEIPFWIYNRSDNIMLWVKYRLKPIPRHSRVPLPIRQHGPRD
jgi:hypothetical protein